ncbi:hypothetical protein TOPH_01884 [Tolypocladium ophioglossoides CBS 100239]|uniref:Uncharacterized protein n=1 Tax=Tolypocladium ophioglossoides (strain CBS 100239) TaxID=1163406 RepID=A0A0L0NI74_TOLOC|nr:hypothetical protein TOPH_01884 [Tolypocladium ophioglossoides CBS 100239]
MYLQHHVGMERQQDNQARLLVFDPSRGDSKSIKRLIGKVVDRGVPKVGSLLKPYRRGTKYLSKHDEFEILQ